MSLLASPSQDEPHNLGLGWRQRFPAAGGPFAFPATALGVGDRLLDRRARPFCPRGVKSFLPQCIAARFHGGVIAGLVHREAGDAFVIADRGRGPKQARCALVIAVDAGQARQTLNGIGHTQKRPSVRGDRQRVMGVARGLFGFALGRGDVGVRGERSDLVAAMHYRDGVIRPPPGRDELIAGQ